MTWFILIFQEADEIWKENENMQAQMHDLETKFDEALS